MNFEIYLILLLNYENGLRKHTKKRVFGASYASCAFFKCAHNKGWSYPYAIGKNQLKFFCFFINIYFLHKIALTFIGKPDPLNDIAIDVVFLRNSLKKSKKCSKVRHP